MAIEEGEREEMNCTNFQMFGAGSQKVESNWSAESSQRNIGAHSSFTVTGMVRSSYSSDFDFNTAMVWLAKFSKDFFLLEIERLLHSVCVTALCVWSANFSLKLYIPINTKCEEVKNMQIRWYSHKPWEHTSKMIAEREHRTVVTFCVFNSIVHL